MSDRGGYVTLTRPRGPGCSLYQAYRQASLTPLATLCVHMGEAIMIPYQTIDEAETAT